MLKDILRGIVYQLALEKQTDEVRIGLKSDLQSCHGEQFRKVLLM